MCGLHRVTCTAYVANEITSNLSMIFVLLSQSEVTTTEEDSIVTVYIQATANNKKPSNFKEGASNYCEITEN